ncbi:MAG: SUMF1/EgtB/PvdO family nonheme iron enzyme [Symploca sp. SIO2G7]|nr:SUMF1/EgtB/PvdO family nonheme iron enzyme [Symploca sp. SIO2G7]
MTDRFTLTAQVLLARRLNNLRRIGEAVEIDTSHITCAEYQLFIDAQKAEGKYVQPDHWNADRFPAGTAKQPIAGVSGNNAAAFCEWLTNQGFTPGFQYRLPTVEEFEAHFVDDQALGCWCREQQNITIKGFSIQQHPDWLVEVERHVVQGELFVLNYALELTLELAICRVIMQLRAAYHYSKSGSHKIPRSLMMAHRTFRKHAYARFSTLSCDSVPDKIHQLGSIQQHIRAAIDALNNRDLDCANNIACELACNILAVFNLSFDVDSVQNLDFDFNSPLADYLNLNVILFPARTIIPFLEINIDTDLNAKSIISKINELLNSLNINLNDDDQFTLSRDNSYSNNLIDQYIQSSLACLATNFNRFIVNLKDLGAKSNRIRKIDREKCLDAEREYTNLRNQIAQLYASFIVLKLRRQGKIPAWEGICIVRERIDE